MPYVGMCRAHGLEDVHVPSACGSHLQAYLLDNLFASV